jgi:hypothetical protein
MSRLSIKSRRPIWVATLLALGACGAAYADDSSMSRFGGDSYAYFNRPVSAANGDAAWRRAHPNGLTNGELVALSSSGLSAAADRLDPPVFSRVAVDATWRQTHPNGFTEREYQARSSSSLAMWQVIPGSATGVPTTNMASDAATGTLSARLKTLFRPERGARAAPQ